jgi:hypothetical protein
MAAAVVPLKSQTTMSVVIIGSTTPPTSMTAAEIIAQGGEGTCRWQAGPYSECSETCEGTQTREVSCQCTLASTEQVRATDDNCDRDDPRIAPLTSRSCGIECPPPTPSPTPAPVCLWKTGPYSECSTTCEGTQARTVTCDCTLATGTITTVEDSVCDQEDPRMKPVTNRSCGIECPGITTADSQRIDD